MTRPAMGRVPAVDIDLGASGTTLRFASLILLLLGSTVAMIGQILQPLVERPARSGCMLAAGLDPVGDLAAGVKPLGINRALLEECYQRTDALPWWGSAVVGGFAGAIVLGAVALYVALPAWRHRHGRAVPVEAVDADGRLGRRLAALVARTGVRQVRFVVDPAAATTGAVAYGHPGRYIVRLHGGLVARLRSDPDGFDAVVLHELAHVHNGDVRIAYATTALWRVFLAGVLLPYVVTRGLFLLDGLLHGTVSVFWGADAPMASRDLLLTLVLTALLTVARADLLRKRELYADLAAVRWGAATAVWSRRAGGLVDGGRRRLIGDLWRSHPRWEQRVRSLREPTALLGPPALPMLVTGIATLVTTARLPRLLGLFGVSGAPAQALVVLLAAGLAAGIVATTMGQAAAHSVVTGRPPPSPLRAGLWFGAGMVVAELLLSRANMSAWLPAEPAMLLALPAAAAVTCWWTAECAELWLRTRPGRPARPVLLAGLVTTWIAVAVWLNWWETFGMPMAIGALIPPDALLEVLRSPAAPDGGWALPIASAILGLLSLWGPPEWLLLGAMLWLYALLPLAWRPSPGAVRPSLSRLAAAASAGAVLACTGSLVANAYVGGLAAGENRALLYLASQIFVLLPATAVTATVVAITARRYRMVMALGAAGLASLLTLGGVWLLGAFDGCLGPFDISAVSCSFRPDRVVRGLLVPVSFLMVLATPVAGVAVLLAGPWRNRLRDDGHWTTYGPAGWTSRVAVAVLTTLAICLPVVLRPPGTFAGDAVADRRGLEATLTRTLVPASTPEVRGVQIGAWLFYGGLDLMDGFVRDYIAVTKIAPDLVVTQENAAGLVTPLRALVADADRVDRYFPIPDPREQRAWARLTATVRGEAGDCLYALARDDLDVCGAALHRLTSAMEEMSALLARLRAIIAERHGTPRKPR
ncbi:hypothetical protein Sme01_00180 [Sphaerisporangium melleum]|uniref:Peptidase M48 domain-containing protein n=1 Tax=Sphaerisporangium melleum TaxID=321316 RepID=A0A917RJC1_9ACTN|nr:M48 family metalloprotease [Sphaerisporangium melleum]GGL09265.1 hypothetical protein GCM10007964_59400 [Sphaerisporangium melleum]GII67542.1 hypothetical protein Sme01_00180 [Sphaerisporangium melleum]